MKRVWIVDKLCVEKKARVIHNLSTGYRGISTNLGLIKLLKKIKFYRFYAYQQH